VNAFKLAGSILNVFEPINGAYLFQRAWPSFARHTLAMPAHPASDVWWCFA
jgi:hypothetical protein